MKGPVLTSSLRPYGTSIFTEMAMLSNKVGAVNLSQGFPDFEGPEFIRRAAAEAIVRGPNQYCPSIGIPRLREAIAGKVERFYQVNVDPEKEITVSAGATEAIAAALFGLLEQGDQVILLEPCYDIYPPLAARAGAELVYVSLTRPGFELPRAELESAFGPKTRAIIINNPHNPSGKVFTREELEFVARLCAKHGTIAISDEVYEHLVYDGKKHISLLQIPEFEGRCIAISSTAKTFSLTGWKVGYAIAKEDLTGALRMVHQFLTFCTPSALQEAMSEAMGAGEEYYREFLNSYTRKRDILCTSLSEMGFKVLWPEGTYYTSIDISELDFKDDLAFCRYLATEVGVAAIPSSFFWKERRDGKDLVRFCFCKKDETLQEAIGRLKRWKV
ncbi:MAG: aminotransferase [Deltaproteobacteria bacterium]|nr:MAG: aminotransferase [Deltaproteobacteria bacterium]